MNGNIDMEIVNKKLVLIHIIHPDIGLMNLNIINIHLKVF